MEHQTIRVATRQSELALWQAQHVRASLLRHNPGLNVELVRMTTQGDRILDQPLAKIGGKGLFIKELQLALLENRADIAVHSMKDVPIEDVEGLEISVVLERADPRDVLVSRHYSSLEELPEGAQVGTSSLRRKSQLSVLRQDLTMTDLRGNVPTRIAHMEAGKYDAIILAAAGLDRLGLHEKITCRLSVSDMLPAVGQGAIGIESRTGDHAVEHYIKPLAHRETMLCVFAERALSRQLQGSCEIPIAAHARLSEDKLSLKGLVASIDGNEIIVESDDGHIDNGLSLGARLGQRLLARGADKIIQAALHQSD
jgi:hydroxymethylbilane synthase